MDVAVAAHVHLSNREMNQAHQGLPKRIAPSMQRSRRVKGFLIVYISLGKAQTYLAPLRKSTPRRAQVPPPLQGPQWSVSTPA